MGWQEPVDGIDALRVELAREHALTRCEGELIPVSAQVMHGPGGGYHVDFEGECAPQRGVFEDAPSPSLHCVEVTAASQRLSVRIRSGECPAP
jgi:hypothetical protein